MINHQFIRTICWIILLAMICNIGNAQTTKVNASNAKTLSQVMKLKISASHGGSNGASVAWNPVSKKYYAAMAGNRDFPLEIFD